MKAFRVIQIIVGVGAGLGAMAIFALVDTLSTDILVALRNVTMILLAGALVLEVIRPRDKL